MTPDYKHSGVTEKIIGAAYEVHSTLGHGFMEKVYENALALQLHQTGCALRQQVPVKVMYAGEIVGNYVADLVVEDKVLVEIKAVTELQPLHEVQLVNYLKATEMEVGLLINFGREVEVKRRIFDQ